MRTINILTLAALLTGLSVYETLAQGSGSSYPTNTQRRGSYGSDYGSTSSAYDPNQPEQGAFEVVKQTKGSVVGVDGQFLTLRTKKNKLVKVQLTPDTNYRRKKEDTIYQDLQEGQLVKVFYKPKESAYADDKAVTVRILE